MAVIVDGSDLYLSGSVGADLFDDFFTFSEVMLALLQVGRGSDVTIHLNSPGGYTDEGTAIANAIENRPGRTAVVVEGIAASAATFIACAADEVVMAEGSLWMIHEPMVTLISANSQALATGVQAQALLTDAYVRTYTRRTGRSEAQVREWMKAETYFGADEAVEAGFADRKSAEVVDLVAVAPPGTTAGPTRTRRNASSPQPNGTTGGSRPRARRPRPPPPAERRPPWLTRPRRMGFVAQTA